MPGVVNCLPAAHMPRRRQSSGAQRLGPSPHLDPSPRRQISRSPLFGGIKL
jgi:hypothetical protein